MIDKQDVIVSLLKEIDKNIENLGGSETDVLLSNRITTLENSVKTINTDINGIKTTNTTQTTNITNNTNKINTTNTNVSNLTTRVTNVEHKANTNESNLNTLNERVTTLENAEPSGGGGGTISGGYPIEIVDVSEIGGGTIDPNVFYKIKHNGGIMLMFASEAEYYNQSGDFAIFTAETTDESLSELVTLFTCGGLLVEDTSLEGYSYKMMLGIDGAEVSVYFSLNPNENSTCTIYVPNISYNGVIVIPTFITELYNITRLNNQGFMYNINLMGTSINTWFIQAEGTVEGKYIYVPTHPMLQQFRSVFTDVPIEEATKVYLQDEFVEMFGVSEIPITKIPTYKEVTETCEYIFEINTPCELMSLHSFYWNNDFIPDLTLPGVLTVSVIGGHACYTFKPTT